MITWAMLRDELVRPLLKDAGHLTDPDIAFKWTDAELLAYANFGLDDLSSMSPLAAYAEATGVDGSRTHFALPDDLIALDAVEVGGQILSEYEPQPGRALPSAREMLQYILDWPRTGYIAFTRAPLAAQTVKLYYSAYRPHLAADGDVVPAGSQRWIEQALAMYTCYLAHLREGVGAASLEQWKGRQDLNVGNPLNLQAREFLQQYQRLVRENRPRELRTYA